MKIHTLKNICIIYFVFICLITIYLLYKYYMSLGLLGMWLDKITRIFMMFSA